jgi:hypothetical protein
LIEKAAGYPSVKKAGSHAGEKRIMKILKYSTIILAALLAAAIGLMSCGNKGGTLTSITVSPADPTIATGTKHQFTAMATFSNGTMLDWTTAADWSTSNAGAVTISNSFGSNGLATSLVSGSSGTISVITITATDTANNISGTAALTVVDPISITVKPNAPFMPMGGAAHQFAATALLSSSTPTIVQVLTSLATWTTKDQSIATVNSKGLVTPSRINTGTTDIIASIETGTSSTVIGSTTLNVTPSALDFIQVTPTVQIISFATTTQQQFTATGTFMDTTTQIMTQSVHWHSSNTGIATISNTVPTNGLALATGATGTTTIRATDPITGKSNSTTLEVTP